MKSIGKILEASKSQSPLEEQEFEEFNFYNLKPIQQYQISYFFVDFAFPNKKVAIEIDGKEFHGGLKKILKDYRRQQLIEEKGWKIERFQGWIVYRFKGIVSAKIALKYFKDQISDRQKKHAIGVIATFLIKNGDRELAEKLMEEEI